MLDPAGSDLIRIDAAFADTSLRFTQRGIDLDLFVDGTNDGMTISGWFQTDSSGVAVHQIERFELSDGRTLQSKDVGKLIAAQATGAAAQASQYWR